MSATLAGVVFEAFLRPNGGFGLVVVDVYVRDEIMDGLRIECQILLEFDGV